MRKILSRVEVLNEEEIKAIHQASVDILESIGVKFPNRTVLDFFRDAGASVDYKNQVARIPGSLINRTLADATKVNAKETCGKMIVSTGTLFGGISTQLYIVDYFTKKRRYGTVNDIVKGSVFCNQLKNIRYAAAIVVPHDVPNPIRDIVSYQLLYTYSSKPGGTYILSPKSAPYILELAKVVGKRPCYLLESVSPLQFWDQGLEIALLFAKNGFPIRLGPMVTAGLSGPITLAGTLAVQSAEILAGIVLVHLLNPEHPAQWSGSAHTADLRTTLCSFGSPSQTLLALATTQMARYYGLSCGYNVGLTDALSPDFQCGFEKGFSVALGFAGGLDSIGPVGLVGADQGISLEQLVIDNEWLDAVNHVFQGVEVNKETIGLEVIREVGIGGNFLDKEHTVRHMRRQYWASDLFNRNNWENSLAKGARDTLQRAHQRVEAILTKHYPPDPVIGDKEIKELQKIVDLAKKTLL